MGSLAVPSPGLFLALKCNSPGLIRAVGCCEGLTCNDPCEGAPELAPIEHLENEPLPSLMPKPVMDGRV
jgi:hypothetical protein